MASARPSDPGEQAFLDSLHAAGSVPPANNSVRVQLYFDKLDKLLSQAIKAQVRSNSYSSFRCAAPKPPNPVGFVRIQETGAYERAFVYWWKYINLAHNIKQHNAYDQKAYQRDKFKVERTVGADGSTRAGLRIKALCARGFP